MMSIKKVILNGKELETPNIFASYRLGDYPNAGLKCLPWKEIEIDALLINAYDFLKPRYRALLNFCKGICKFLDFKKTIMMDSGGFYFIEKKHIDIDPLEILNIETKARVDIGIVLDHPMHPKASNPHQRVKKTLKNASIMFKALSQGNNNTFKLIPVIQGYDNSVLDYSINYLSKTMEKYNGGTFDYAGIGGLVPLSQRCDKRLVDIIAYVRERLPDAHLHCFSLGSPLMMLLAFYCGADTVDTQGWIKSAAYRAINLPGIGSINLRLKDKTEKPKYFEKSFNKLENHLNYLESSEGFKPLYSLEELVDTPTENRLHNRAIHNLYTYIYEAKKAREALEKEYFNEFTEERFSRTRLKTLFERAKAVVTKCEKISC
jgi:tRNA-guanine family transglycosylase